MICSKRSERVKGLPFMLCLSLLAYVAGCGDERSAPSASLLDGKGAPAAGASGNGEDVGDAGIGSGPLSGDEEAERLRKMQLVRVVGYGDLSLDIPPSGVAISLYNACAIANYDHIDVSGLSADCAPIYPELNCLMQTAGVLLEIAGSAHAPTPLPIGENTMYVTPQPVAPRFVMAYLAAGYAYRANELALQTLQGEGVDQAQISVAECPSGRCQCDGELAANVLITLPNPDSLPGATTPHPQSLGGRLTGTAIEGYHLLKEASALMSELGLAVADAQRSDTSSEQEGMRRQLTAAELSRAHLSHMLIGGDPGFNNSFEPEGLCAIPDLTPSSMRALSLLREAAMSPEDIVDTSVSLEDLIDDNYRAGGSGAHGTHCGSLRERLYQQWGDESIADEPGSIAERFGLARGDFLMARDYLIRELNTFARSHTAVLEPGACNDGSAGEEELAYPLFAATRNEPGPIDPVYWTTLLRFADDSQFSGRALNELPFMSPYSPSDRDDPLSLDVGNGIAGAVDDTIIRSFDAVKNLSTEANGLGIEEDLMGALHLMLSDAMNERGGRLYVMRLTNASYKGQSAAHATVPLLWGTQVADQAIIVNGEDGLRCALYGNIDGADCSDAQLNALTVGALNRDYRAHLLELFSALGPGGASEAERHMARMPDSGASFAFLNTASLPNHRRLYVVKPRAGENDGNAGAGEYVAVTGFLHRTSGHPAPAGDLTILADASDIDVYSIVPELERKAASYVEPNRRWCNHQQLSCAGTTFDERLALENELTEGGATGEDSWRHYLTLARQAASEADELGQAYLQAEIERQSRDLADVQIEEGIRERREDDLEQLQSICGTSIESDTLFEILVPTGNIRDAAPQGCTTEAERTACAANDGTCMTGLCYHNSTSRLAERVDNDPDLYRLQQCAEASGGGGLGAAGDQYLCVTYGGGNKNRICEANGQKLDAEDCPSRLEPPSPALNLTPQQTLEHYRAICQVRYADLLGAEDATALAQPLGYFKIDETRPPAASPVDVCHAFREARAATALTGEDRRREVQRAINAMRSEIFFFETIQQNARHIGWDAANAPTGAIQFKGTNMYPVPNGGWPCRPADPMAPPRYPSASIAQSCQETMVGATNPSYFCQQIDCGSDEQRGEWSQRSFWATVALRAMAYRGSESWVEWQQPSVVPPALKPMPGGALSGIGILGYGPRLDSGIVVGLQPPVQYDNFYAPDAANPSGHYILVSNYAGELTYEIMNGATHLPAVPPYDGFAFNPDGSRINSHSGTQLLKNFPGHWLAPVMYDSSPSRNELCGVLRPAPMWWMGLELPGTPRPFMQSDAASTGVDYAPDPANPIYGPYANASWITKHLLGETSTAPRGYLWEAMAFAGCNEAIKGLPYAPNSFPEQRTSSSLLRSERDAELGAPGVTANRMQATAPSSNDEINQAALDAVELYCHFQLEYKRPPQVVLKNPPPFRGVEDLDDAAAYFREVAVAMNDRASKLLFAGLPEQALDALALNPVNSAYPALGGELSQSVTELRDALVTLSTAAPGMASEVEMLSYDIAELRDRLEVFQLRRDQVEIQQMAEAVGRAAECAAAASPTVSVGLGASVSFNTGAIAICANAFAQIGFSARVNDIEKSIQAKEAQALIDAFGKGLAERRDKMRRYADHIISANEIINNNLAKIDGLRARARRAAARAVYMSTELAAKQAAVSTSARALANVDRVRYERALTNAKRLAFLAKRAIEQRIGMSLSEMTESLPLVESPSTWEARACSTTGIDFETFQALGDEEEGEENSLDLNAFADQYIGDYVTKLENLIESYPLYFNFHEGHDTAVISLRDDVLTSNVMCDVPTGNLLFHSNDLGEIAAMDDDGEVIDPGAEGWTLEGCARDVDGTPLRNCISVTEVAGDSPLDPGLAPGQLVSFGNDGVVCDYDNVSAPRRCGYTETSLLRQDVFLEAGKYLLSWYAKDSSTAAQLMYVRDEQGSVVSGATAVVAGTGAWRRYFTLVDASISGGYSIVIEQPASSPASVLVAGVMFEDITRTPRESVLEPGHYLANEEALTRTLPACEDSFGVKFPSQWRYKCANLCPNGFGAACSVDAASTRCFYEATFGLSQREIESGAQLRYSGFATGNFNYRIDSIAVNFVGTGTRDCDDSVSSCYTQGTIPYTISHDGPYYVRNHEGADYEAKLFPGWIEHARGLAAERVITNPISTADRALFQDFIRSELSGRPLDGLFTVRVWDEPGVNFSAVEDVQIVLNYDYWTRFK